MKLFLVSLRGMGNPCGIDYSSSYVVAADPTEAVKKVRAYLDAHDLGFRHERELREIKLLAESGDYPECRTMLFL